MSTKPLDRKQPRGLEIKRAIWQRNIEGSSLGNNEQNVSGLLEALKGALPDDSAIQSIDGQDEISLSLWVKSFTTKPRASNINTDFVQVPRSLSFDSRHYHPLAQSEFRLLQLEPGTGEDHIVGRLIIADLQDPPDYTSLSYLWGTNIEESSIDLDGEPCVIRQSQTDVLTRIRHPRKKALVWLDYLCIDQHSASEKSHQVALMGQIYEKAAEVALWLGPASSDSKVGMQTLQFLANGRGFESDPPWLGDDNRHVAEGLKDLLKREYFSRLWHVHLPPHFRAGVVQEGALSSYETTMMCGSDDVIWTCDHKTVRNFARGLKYAVISSRWTNYDRSGDADAMREVDVQPLVDLLDLQLQQIRRRLGYAALTPNPDLLDIAYNTRHKTTSYVSDQLYAILGLASIQNGEFFRPDYTKSPSEVYESFRQALLASTETDALEEEKELHQRAEETPAKSEPASASLAKQSKRHKNFLALATRHLKNTGG